MKCGIILIEFLKCKCNFFFFKFINKDLPHRISLNERAKSGRAVKHYLSEYFIQIRENDCNPIRFTEHIHLSNGLKICTTLYLICNIAHLPSFSSSLVSSLSISWTYNIWPLSANTTAWFGYNTTKTQKSFLFWFIRKIYKW